MTAVFLFLQAIMADDGSDFSCRLAAANSIIRLLGLNRHSDRLVDTGAEGVLASIPARQAARIASAGTRKHSDGWTMPSIG